MFIHIGEEHVIQSKDVVAIIDCDLLTSSSIVDEMIMNQKRNQKVIDSSYDQAKSIVVTTEFIYFSTLSVTTLKKRSSLTSTLDKLEDFSDEYEE
ncbi:extracellular matrix regulator RemB [Salinibacillus xinjiangensis]|uniref:DUF370 domain-containing protein n=1 Tax=Salinibacillus xinjiangensis TaxID=1229268 RepID=A0A6G1XAL6_9BACI|nr:DUF370 domain-containing protein [Salinibacillus xinjiangensis]MRG87946.1 DUF370 domain-containing protein [Salinibacillus xinjiangensis]